MVTSPGVPRAVCAAPRTTGVRSDQSTPPATALAARVRNVLRFSSLVVSCSSSDSNMMLHLWLSLVSPRSSAAAEPKSLHGHKVRRLPIRLRKDLFQIVHLGRIVEADVHAVRMQRRIVLVMRLRRIETFQGHHLRDNRVLKHAGSVQLFNVSLGDAQLIGGRVEEYGAILAAFIGPLPVQFGGIMRHGKEHMQKLSISNLRGIEDHFDRLGMPGLSRADDFVLSGFRIASRISGGGADHTLHVLEHGLNTPKTSAGEYYRFLARRLGKSCVDGRRWYFSSLPCLGGERENHHCCQESNRHQPIHPR